MEGLKKVFCCPLRCIYHGERRSDGTFCDSTYGGKEQEFCVGENYCKIAEAFKQMQLQIDDLERKLGGQVVAAKTTN